ncbi:hypothetical protein HY496_02345 [Candidatus Woesearchaeota archaeon]|nr:hypothetical protein [Candidatus Woesearchaeota archaeon]
MGWLSKAVDWVKEKFQEPKTLGPVYQRDLERRRQIVEERMHLRERMAKGETRPLKQEKTTEIVYKEKELRDLLRETYEGGTTLLAAIEGFHRVFIRHFTPYNAPAWKDKLGKEIIVPAIKYWEKISRVSQLVGTGVGGDPTRDVQKMQAYRNTLSAVADKDFKDSGSQFLDMLQKAVRARQNEVIKILAQKVGKALEPPHRV